MPQHGGTGRRAATFVGVNVAAAQRTTADPNQHFAVGQSRQRVRRSSSGARPGLVKSPCSPKCSSRHMLASGSLPTLQRLRNRPYGRSPAASSLADPVDHRQDVGDRVDHVMGAGRGHPLVGSLQTRLKLVGRKGRDFLFVQSQFVAALGQTDRSTSRRSAPPRCRAACRRS